MTAINTDTIRVTPHISLFDGVPASNYINHRFVRVTTIANEATPYKDTTISSYLSSLGFVAYNSKLVRVADNNNHILDTYTTEYHATNYAISDDNLFQAMNELASGTGRSVIIDMLFVGQGYDNSPLNNSHYWRIINKLDTFKSIGLDTNAYTFSVPDAETPIVYGLYTSKYRPLVVTLAEPKFYPLRTAATLYLSRVGKGFISATTAEELLARLAGATEEDAVITKDLNLFNPVMLYKLALLINGWIRVYGYITDQIVNTLASNYFSYHDIASRIDTRIDWDYTSPLPIPASNEELDELFRDVPGNPAYRISI